MKTITVRELTTRTAKVLDDLERGETLELRRNGKALGYLSRTTSPRVGKPDWKSHFEWLRKQPERTALKLLKEFESDRTRQNARENALGNLS